MPRDAHPTEVRLTGNDLARSESAIQLALAWWRKQPGNSQFKKNEVAAYTALLIKLRDIGAHAYPYTDYESMPLDIGGETIMRADLRSIARTRRAAIRRQEPGHAP